MFSHGAIVNLCAFTIYLFIKNAMIYIFIGERCISCLLQHISPNKSDICVGDTQNITITTNQSQPHGSAFTLLINDSVCHSGGASSVVSCREQGGDVLQHTFSYHVTAINPGIVTIKAHTTYYGAEWYSTSEVVSIRECDAPEDESNTPEGDTPKDESDTPMGDIPEGECRYACML